MPKSCFADRVLGRSGLTVGPLGMSSSYGMPATAVEEAFERGMNYLYWGTFRRAGFAEGIRNLRAQRERMVLVVQSYTPIAGLIGPSLRRALRRLGFDYADVLLLGLWGKAPPERILDACRELRSRGLVRHVAMSTHNRPLVAELAGRADFSIFHLRYNAVHRGAEADVFARLPQAGGPGIVAYTATSWRQLMDAKRTPTGERTPTVGDCYRFVLSHPAVHLCMTGTSNIEQTRHALRALDQGPMDESELAWMRRVGDAIYQ